MAPEDAMKLKPGVEAEALFSTDLIHRYSLTRDWDRSKGTALWVMLNPSTATATEDDATIRKCQKFARAWDLGGIVVANIFTIRGSKPTVIRHAIKQGVSPIGRGADEVLTMLARQTRVAMVVAAWGANGSIQGRGEEVRGLLHREGVKLHAMRLTACGHPWHPLYLPDDLEPFEWDLEP